MGSRSSVGGCDWELCGWESPCARAVECVEILGVSGYVFFAYRGPGVGEVLFDSIRFFRLPIADIAYWLKPYCCKV